MASSEDIENDGAVPIGSGDSMEDAVVIRAPDTWSGIEQEYEHVAARFGPRGVGWNLRGQSLLQANGRAYDRLDITLADGAERSLYFDITAFFGH